MNWKISTTCFLFGMLPLASALAVTASGQSSSGPQGPIAPPPKFDVKRIPIQPNPDAPPVPTADIIQRFTANEDVMKKAYQKYTLEQDVRIQEEGDPADPGGSYELSGQLFTKPDGERVERILKRPVISLKRVEVGMEDVQFLTSLPAFVLTTDQLPLYVLSYEGTEQLDQLHTYIFRVKPKRLLRGIPLFDGAVWVDDQDFAIVKTYGQYVTDSSARGTVLPFKFFETFRENFAQKYWFPTYVRSDDYMPIEKSDPVHLRLVIKSVNVHPEEGAPPPPPAPAAPPADVSAPAGAPEKQTLPKVPPPPPPN
jgi:hypothetical protein